MFKVFETVSMNKEQLRVMTVVILAASLLLAFNGLAMAMTAPSADGFVYDLYDIGVNKILKGAPGFVIGVGAIAWGGSHLFKSAVVPAVTSMLGGGVILKADSIVTTLGMTIFQGLVMEVPIPQYLSRPMCVLWWETDEFIVWVMSFAFAVFIGGIVPVGIALCVCIAYRHFRKSAGRGFVQHLPYILGFKSFEGFPHAYVEKFEE